MPRTTRTHDPGTEEEVVELITCDNCASRVAESSTFNDCEEGVVCDSCRDGSMTCGQCGRRYADTSEWERTQYGDSVCCRCQSSGTIPMDSQYWHHYDDLYQHSDGEYYTYEEEQEEDDYESDYDDEDGPIGGYHGRESSLLPGSTTGNYVGFELEVVPQRNRNALARKILDQLGGRVERDGSLPDHGFEVISDFGEPEAVYAIASKLSDILTAERVHSHNRPECGLHVHLSKNGASAYQIARMVVFWNKQHNSDFLKKFTRRWGNSFCRPNPDQGERVVSSYGRRGDRYALVNVTPRNTVEVRAFRGTTKKETLLACLQLARASWDFAKDLSVCDVDLTWERFLDWLPADSGVLEYARTKGFQAPGRQWEVQEVPPTHPALDVLLEIAHYEQNQGSGEEFHRTMEAHGFYVSRQAVIACPQEIREQFVREVEGRTSPRPKENLEKLLRRDQWRDLQEVTMGTSVNSVRGLECVQASNGSHYDRRYIRAVQSLYPSATFRVAPNKNLIVVNGEEPVACIAHRVPQQ